MENSIIEMIPFTPNGYKDVKIDDDDVCGIKLNIKENPDEKNKMDFIFESRDTSFSIAVDEEIKDIDKNKKILFV